MDQTTLAPDEGSSKASIVEKEGLTQQPANESGSDGKNAADEAIGVTITEAAQQPVEHVGPTMRRGNYALQSNYGSPPLRDNAYNFIWGEDTNFLTGEETKVPAAGGSKFGLERSNSLQATQSLTGEKAGTSSEQDAIKSLEAHPPIVTQDMRTLFAQQQREIRNSIAKQNEKGIPQTRAAAAAKVTAKDAPGQSAALDLRESILERREREFDRREREIDRRERDLERRERELERRQREFENDKGRWSSNGQNVPHWQETIESFKNQIKADLLAERKKAIEREALFEEKVIKKVNKILEHERQLYDVMRMSENEVNEMVESSVGYFLHTVRPESLSSEISFVKVSHMVVG